MSNLNRRGAVKLVAGLALGAGSVVAHEVRGQDGEKADDRQPPDGLLDAATKSPQGFMFVEQVTSKLKGDGAGYDLVITSAQGIGGAPEAIRVRSATMAIFRADASRDEFTRQGGWYWKCGKEEGKSQFKEQDPFNGQLGPGTLVMVVREMDGTIHWYSLTPDLRC